MLRNIDISEETFLYVDDDDDFDSVCAKVEALDADVPMICFDMASRALKYGERIRAGRYAVSDTLSTLQLVRNLRNHSSVPLQLVVPASRTLDAMAGRVARGLMVDSAAIYSALTDPERCEALGFSANTIAALIIPNTYEVYWETSVDDLLLRLKRENERFWNVDRQEKANALGLTPLQVATLASIVDGETANDAEKPTIAGLYLNRLNRGMLLQSDPTVIFAHGDWSIRRVTNKHLAIDSPYNTYRYAGLPPGPIRIPSVSALDAVLNPAHHNYIYMCAKEDFSGTHNFAATYAEHQANARRYINALNARGVR